MNIWWWMLTAVSTLGIVGIIIAAIFAPPLALAIWKAIYAFMSWFWSTRLGVGVIIGLAVFYATSWYQSRIDNERFAAESAAFKEAQSKRDKDIDLKTSAAVTIDLAKQAKKEQELENAGALFTKGLDPGRACLVGDDADGLRELAGQGRSQGEHHSILRRLGEAAKKAAADHVHH